MAITEKEITLDSPVTVAGEKVTKVTFRKLTIGMMLDANVEATMAYGMEPTNGMIEPYAYAIACEIPVEELLGLGFEELQKFQEANLFLRMGGVEAKAAQDAKGEKAKDDPDSPESKT